MYCCNHSSRKLVEAVLGFEVAEKNEFVVMVDHWVAIIKANGVAAALAGVAELWRGSELGDELSEIGDLRPAAMKLKQPILEALQDEGLVLVPSYNREVTPDRNLIYHLGVGGFHRSHQVRIRSDDP